jgi:hypothetical protein
MSLSRTMSDFELAEKNPTVFQLATKLDPILTQYGLEDHIAQVALLLDGSGSMDNLYRSGAVQTLVERMLPFGLRWDDNGVIDTWVFSSTTSNLHETTLDNLPGAVDRIMRGYSMNSTDYTRALETVISHYDFRTRQYPAEMPVYLIFVTDGAPDSKQSAIHMMQEASRYPMFIQFVAIGEDWPTGGEPTPPPQKKSWWKTLTSSVYEVPKPQTSSMQFLVELDEKLNTDIDACNAFAVQSPSTVAEERLYSLMTREYPLWIPKARDAGLLR